MCIFLMFIYVLIFVSKERKIWVSNQNPPKKQKSKTRWFHWWILPNTWRKINTNPSQTFPENWRGGNTTKLILWGQYYLDTTTRLGHYKKRKLQANIPDEHRCKKPQHNISNPNSTIYLKDYIPWSRRIYPWDARIVQHPQINVIHHINTWRIKTI